MTMKKKLLLALLAAGMMLGSTITSYAVPERMEDGTLFDSDYYAETYPDLMLLYGRDTQKLYEHYVNCGKAEGRQILPSKFVYPDLPAPASGEAYTMDELVAIFRNIIESNGITWDPSLKGNWDSTIGQHDILEWYNYDDNYTGTGWGTGFLEPNHIERNAYSDLLSFEFDEGTGHSTTRYYFEVLGWDEYMGMIEIVAWSA